LNDRKINCFENLYAERIEWRQAFGKAVSYSLKTLLNTGCKAQGAKERFNALWMPFTRTAFEVTFANKHLKWAGITQDTATSGAVGIVTEECIEFYSRRRAFSSLCRAGDISSHTSVFHTKFLIDDSLDTTPKGLSIRNNNWDFTTLKHNTTFDLRKSGQLRFLWRYGSGAIMTWEKPNAVLETLKRFKELVLDRGPTIVHREYVTDDPTTLRPVPIWIVPTAKPSSFK
jgi:hypothetical protein